MCTLNIRRQAVYTALLSQTEIATRPHSKDRIFTPASRGHCDYSTMQHDYSRD